MTAEQLEELLGKVTQGEWRLGVDSEVYAEGECDTWITVGPKSYDAVAIVVNEHIKSDAEVGLNARLIAMAPTLARRVIMAEKLVEQLDELSLPYKEQRDALTAYREASK